MTTRRTFIAGCGAVALAPVLAPVLASAPQRALRIGMTPAFLHDQYGVLADWRLYMESKLKRRVEFLQRDSYRETIDLLRLAQLDFAWICDYPYLYLRDYVELLAVPLYHDQPYYRAYLISSGKYPQIWNLRQLRGKIFAYSDPYSSTGCLVPRYQLHTMGEDPNKFFARTFYTYSHRKVIEAVGEGLAHAGSVDSIVWDALDNIKPEITLRAWLVSQSPDYGAPPLVAHRAVPREDVIAMREMLITMRYDPQGKALLKRLQLDGFTVGERKLYDRVAGMMRALGEY